MSTPDRGRLPQTNRHPQTSTDKVTKRQTRSSVVDAGNQFLILRNLVWASFCGDVHFSSSSMAKYLSSVAEGTYKSLVTFFRTCFPAKARNTPCTRPLLFCRHYEASDDGKDGSLGGVMVMVYRGQSVGLRGRYGLVQTTTDLGDFPDVVGSVVDNRGNFAIGPAFSGPIVKFALTLIQTFRQG
ncbi:hypothetical protein B0H13DRAFT_1910359 [Mycena leptocephala]|nr:hypothetical protein B0H13DRAFT_1910359 [Mycena leptocephala]